MHFDFSVCSERSGSNLIAKMMNAHSQICGPFPSHMFRMFATNYYRYGDLSVDTNWKTFLEDAVYYMNNKFADWRTSLTVEELEQTVHSRTLAEVGRAFYEAEARAHGKSRVWVKENHAYRIADYLVSHFPDARFVAVVRDPRDMAATWRDLASGGVKRGAAQWKIDQRGTIELHAKLRDIGKSILVSFEDLVLEPEPTLRRICSFLGVDYQPAMLDFYTEDIVVQNAEKMVSWKDLKKPLDPQEVGKYKQVLNEVETRYVEALCREEMPIFGYQPDYPAKATPEELEPQLPPPSETDRPRTETEKSAYARFRSGIERIESRALY